MMQSEIVRIPYERIAVIIGKAGITKAEIEKKTSTKLDIDSESGEVEIKTKNPGEKYIKAMSIVKAIGRGFSPEHAYRLLEENCFLYVVELDELAKTEKQIVRKKGRVIGKHGRAREEIEEDTGALISVYGKTIAIIGNEDEIDKAKKSIDMLLEGAAHEKVFDFLKKPSDKKFEL
jgi:ribosomal RNA assembly protein